MSAIDNIPSNKNFLSPLGFVFNIKKTPHVNYFIQSATLPGVKLGQSDIQTPFNKIPLPGDHLEFSNFEITFRVDEDLKNYEEIFFWMVALGFPDNFTQFSKIADKRGSFGGGVSNRATGEGIYSEISLAILNSVKAPIVEFVFQNAYPVQMSDITFDTKMTDVDYIDCTVTFGYDSYMLNRF